jgi:hypothetical protein
VSVDAGTRTMLRGEGFHQQVGLGEVVLAGGVGRIVESTVEGWQPGQAVRGGTGVQTLATVTPKVLAKVDDTVGPLSVHLNALGGSTGVTAWIGVRQVAKPQPGEDFVVSAAAGAVGSIVGQIAKRDGAPGDRHRRRSRQVPSPRRDPWLRRIELGPGDKLILPRGAIHAEGEVLERTVWIVGIPMAANLVDAFGDLKDPATSPLRAAT